MAKVTEYPRITKMKDNDILLVDGPDGTRTILQTDASKQMGGEVIMVNETAGDSTKVVINTTGEDIELALMADLAPVEEDVSELKTQLIVIEPKTVDKDLSNEAVDKRWYSGHTVGEALTVASQNGTKSISVSVSEGDRFQISCKGGSGRAYYFLDSNDLLAVNPPAANAGFTDYDIIVPSGVSTLIVQTNNTSQWKVIKYSDLSNLSDRIADLNGQISGIDSDLNDITPIVEDSDLSNTYVAKRWYLYDSENNTITENDNQSGTRSSVLAVLEGERYRITAKGGTSGCAYYLLDGNNNVVDHGNLSETYTNKVISISAEQSTLIVQTNSTIYWSVAKMAEISKEDIYSINERIDHTNSLLPSIYWSDTKYGTSKLARLKTLDSGIVNVGFIGDSWTQGTEDGNTYETYVKWLSKKLWEDFGFGGLGWLDFALDGGTTSGKMFGCADLYENWQYEFTGNISGYDGSGTGAANCLGICCAHTIFGNGSTLHLEFNLNQDDSHKLDKFKLAFYKNAHFTVSINNGEAVEITANGTDGWQEVTLGTTGTDTNDVLITALADDTVIFGMDCFYGTKGVRCHKIGNRSLKLLNYLLMDGEQFESGLASLDLSWVSVLFAINDIAFNDTDSACETIILRYYDFIDRVKTACTRSNLMSCDINILGIANIPASGRTGLPRLEVYEKKFATDNGYGWISTRECMGIDKDELSDTGLFVSDGIHLNKVGTKLFAGYIYEHMFRDLGIV